jgi:hypothetical protein
MVNGRLIHDILEESETLNFVGTGRIILHPLTFKVDCVKEFLLWARLSVTNALDAFVVSVAVSWMRQTRVVLQGTVEVATRIAGCCSFWSG